MRNNRTAMHKQSSGWWILVLILCLAIAYALGGVLGPVVFKRPAQQKIKTVKPAIAPVVAPSEPIKPPVKLAQPKDNKAGSDVEVEVIENKTGSTPKPDAAVKPSVKPEPKPEVVIPKPKPAAKLPVLVVSPKPKVAAKHEVVPENHQAHKPEVQKATKQAPTQAKPKVKAVVKPQVKPKVSPPVISSPTVKPKPVPPKPSLPVQQPTRLDDQTKLPPVTPAAGVYRVLSGSRYSTWSDAKSNLARIRTHVPGASIIKSSQGGYVVQLAQYRVRQNVNKFTNELRQKGITYTVR